MAKKKLKRYKKLIISHDCLVPKGAMEVESVFKEDGYFQRPKEAIYKFDDEKQIMYNVMVLFGKEDSQGWILDDEEVRRETLVDYLSNGDKVLKFTHKKDDDGEPFDINAHVMEVYTVKSNDEVFPDYVGSIARSAYFPNKDEYNIIKNMEFQSSIEGTAALEEFEVDVDKGVKKKMHKIKDLLINVFDFKDGQLTKKRFNDYLEEVIEKDFETVLENRKNNDVYFAVTALATAIYDAEWEHIYEDHSPENFKKAIAKIFKQAKRYFDTMTFERIEKDDSPENKEGEKSMLGKEDVQKMIDDTLTKTLGLEDGQTLADVIKAAGEKTPPEPVVKDAEGNEITLTVALKGIQDSIDANKTVVDEKMVELEKGITENKEKIIDPVEEVKPVEKSKEETNASVAG